MAIKTFDVPIPEGGRNYSSKYVEDIRTFLRSGCDSAEVAVPPGAKPKSVASGYIMAIKRTPDFLGKVRTVRRGNHVFLERADPAKED